MTKYAFKYREKWASGTERPVVEFKKVLTTVLRAVHLSKF